MIKLLSDATSTKKQAQCTDVLTYSGQTGPFSRAGFESVWVLAFPFPGSEVNAEVICSDNHQLAANG